MQNHTKKQHKGSQAQHTHSLEDHTQSIQQSTSTQQQNKNYTQGYCDLFYQTIHKHCLTRLVFGVLDRVYELFGETIRNVFGCGCCFVAECYGCYVGGYGDTNLTMSESGLCVFREWSPVRFLVVGEGPSVLL